MEDLLQTACAGVHLDGSRRELEEQRFRETTPEGVNWQEGNLGLLGLWGAGVSRHRTKKDYDPR